jgi:hypothetical protein
MHYANGKEAKLYDKIVGKDTSGDPIAGLVISIHPGSNTCNLSVIPFPKNTWTVSAKDCLHIEDIAPDQTTK